MSAILTRQGQNFQLINKDESVSYLLTWKFRINAILFNNIKTMIKEVFSFSVIHVTNINYILFHQTGHAVGTEIL